MDITVNEDELRERQIKHWTVLHQDAHSDAIQVKYE